tara:strand:- start:330 stop:515 length:186 start_codon:yes stop_codon:yes gene_type:complete
MNLIAGYILVLVTILADGTVTGEAIDYFKDPHECYSNVQWEEEIAEPGVGFVCIEDVINYE